MTPKEKAQILFEKFIFKTMELTSDKSRAGETNAKECALIVSNEMIIELSDLPRIPYNERRTWYWQEVKEEIEKL